ncbi:MerR family transcriptional regulator [Actinomadura cremea]|nr:MerR family transcriptional regulator [Actinomadura cremea]
MRAPQPIRPGARPAHRDPHSARPGPAPDAPDTGAGKLDDKLDDEDYPAYSMGRAAEILGVTPGFLRGLDAAKLFVPQRSPGGHRRYSRYQLRLAQRARDMVDQGTALDAACRIIILEDQLTEAQRINAQLQQRIDQAPQP